MNMSSRDHPRWGISLALVLSTYGALLAAALWLPASAPPPDAGNVQAVMAGNGSGSGRAGAGLGCAC